MCDTHTHTHTPTLFDTNLDDVFVVGIAGPVGSGKTALAALLSRHLHDEFNMAVVTNDVYTAEDAQFLIKNSVLPAARVRGVETGACPHSAIRDDVSMNIEAILDLRDEHDGLELVIVESGGDNLTASFSPDLADAWIYVIDVSAGDKIPRKGGPGVSRSDLLVINKIDLAPLVGADLDVMDRDAKKMRGDLPFCFTNLKNQTGLETIISWLRSGMAAR